MEKRGDYFERVMRCVCMSCNVSEDMLVHSKTERCSDARGAMVYLLSEVYSDVEIAELTGLPRRSVNDIKNKWHEREKRNRCHWIVESVTSRLMEV